MAFWSTDFKGDGSEPKDPKRKFRFKVIFSALGGGSTDAAVMWYAKTVTKPSFTIEATEHAYLNHKFFYPGAVSWQDVSLTLVDPSDPDMTATFADIIQAGGYQPPATADAMGTMSKAKAASALGQVEIIQIDADGGDLETWTLHNAFITEVKYGDLAYGDDALVEMSVTLKYDWARVVTAGTSVAEGVNASGGTEFFATTTGA
jgi:hypothetical protein